MFDTTGIFMAAENIEFWFYIHLLKIHLLIFF